MSLKMKNSDYFWKYKPDLVYNEMKVVVTPNLERYSPPRNLFSPPSKSLISRSKMWSIHYKKEEELRLNQKDKATIAVTWLLTILPTILLILGLCYHLKTVNKEKCSDITDLELFKGKSLEESSSSLNDFQQINNNFNPDLVPDYALASAGAKIFKEPDAETYNNRIISWYLYKLFGWSDPNDVLGPKAILQPWKSPGECWAFAGNTANVQIQLSHLIVPQAVTVEHIPINLNPSGQISSAPRHFSVYATDADEGLSKEYLGSFEYLQDGEPVQSFQLLPRPIQYPTRILQFTFHSNHGNPDYTCVYKLRVHGDLFQL